MSDRADTQLFRARDVILVVTAPEGCQVTLARNLERPREPLLLSAGPVGSRGALLDRDLAMRLRDELSSWLKAPAAAPAWRCPGCEIGVELGEEAWIGIVPEPGSSPVCQSCGSELEASEDL